MNIDDRINYLMIGANIILIPSLKIGIGYILVVILGAMAMSFFIGLTKAVGEGDIHILNWIITGLLFIELGAAVWFGIIFAVIASAHLLIKGIVFKSKENTPFCGVILLCFVITMLMYGMY